LKVIVKPFNFTSSGTSLCGGILILFGLIGSVAGIFIEVTKYYKFTLNLLTCSSLRALIFIIGALIQKN